MPASRSWTNAWEYHDGKSEQIMGKASRIGALGVPDDESLPARP
jgi:hypothetical protein